MNPEPQKSSALVSLTATYTDSEGEEEGSGSDYEKTSVDMFDKQSASRESTPSLISPFPEVTSNLKSSLVSYPSHEGIGEEDDDYEMVKIVDSSYSDTENVSKQTPVRTGDPTLKPLSPIAYHRTLLTMTSPPDVIELPPEFPGRCSNALQEKIAKHYEKKIREGKNMNEAIQRRKDFRNPSIYEKLVSYCAIDEKGTNYPPEIYDPHCWGTESFYDELARRQKEEMDKREKERKDRTKVEFMSGTVKKPQDLGAPMAITGDVARRKSKWDMGVGGSQVLAPSNLKPAALVTPNVVVSATGTKPTVISAFGTITKKGKP